MQATPVLQRAIRRLALTTKQGPHNYYKGNRTGAMGRHTKYGGYVLDYRKIRTYVCPDLADFNLTPFVSRAEEGVLSNRTRYNDNETRSPMDGKAYLESWKREGGTM